MNKFGTAFLSVSFMIVIITFYVFIIIIRITILTLIRNMIHQRFKKNIVTLSENEYYNTNRNKYKDVSKDKLATFNTENINTLKDCFYDIFLRFEMAYNNLDYNMMRMLSTKQLFQNYYTGISLDLKAGQKKIISNIERKKVVIYELDSTTVKQTLSAMIEISYITYTINNQGNIISGNRMIPVTERFEVTFRKDFEKDNVVKCPNCGAILIGNKCEYCRSIIKDEEFKISSIKKIVDK